MHPQVVDESNLSFHGVTKFAGLADYGLALVRPRLSHREQEARESNLAVPVNGRVVSAGHEGPAVGQQKDRHRPAAVAAQELGGGHIESIHVGAFFSVNFDRNE